tara:strand:+ start:6355 stop:6918 length:564 start_codon:yes stop_codon:yes gene_type:complete
MFRPDIKAMFVRLNNEHFNGEIPDIPVVWNTRMTTTAGYCRYKRSRVLALMGDNQELTVTKIDMSDKLFRHLDYDLNKIERTMIHEMVHAYLLHKYNERGHTRRFQRMMTDITGEYKNHRCHNYDTVGIKRKQEKKVKWTCSGCDANGLKVRMPKRPNGHICRGCRSPVTFVDMSKKTSSNIFPPKF